MDNKIAHIEKLWLEELILFNTNHFKNYHLFSHNENHHIRVWEICKEIIQSLSKVQQEMINIETLLFASMFHDTGLVLSNGFNHGAQSKEIFIEYRKKYSIQIDNCNLIETCIEFHDDKSYVSKPIIDSSEFKILCVADDLDAFGIIGIYRYLEIYLIREIKQEDIPQLVLDNVESRFNNFKQQFGELRNLFSKYQEKYFVTLKFFDSLKQELKLINDENSKNDAIEVLNLINTYIIKDKKTIFNIISIIEELTNNTFTIDFFKNLNLELKYYEEITHS